MCPSDSRRKHPPPRRRTERRRGGAGFAGARWRWEEAAAARGA
ncbi:unnamed protein product [Spirodela intermedia]|uniref:Uncharacterized protein n=1 Tax=Spirodela intermedia TaxID=51605 RepID=A0A7I8KFT7_SPIIN|nr:unnamed protein product [Spirodela intermedia]